MRNEKKKKIRCDDDTDGIVFFLDCDDDQVPIPKFLPLLRVFLGKIVEGEKEKRVHFIFRKKKWHQIVLFSQKERLHFVKYDSYTLIFVMLQLDFTN